MATEQELVERAKRGDPDAFGQLVTDNEKRIYNLALRMTGSPEDAAELAQEAFLNAWRGLHRFQGESSFATWLYRLASNACIDFLRREKRRRSLSMTVSLDDETCERQAELPDQRSTPEQPVPDGPPQLLPLQVLRRAIRDGLQRLSEEHRQVLVMREVSGLSYAEIGQVLELEPGTVKSRIARARLALRKALESEGNLLDGITSVRGKGP